MITLTDLNLTNDELVRLMEETGQPLAETPKASKWKNVKTEVDGLVFDSGMEARRYIELRHMEQAGEITDLDRQVPFVLQEGYPAIVNGKKRRMRAIKYKADFTYRIPGFAGLIVEDVKGNRRSKSGKKSGGTRTALFSIKERLFRLKFPYPAYDFRIVEM